MEMNILAQTPARTGSDEIDIEALINEYCPPLEAGLVYALSSDFDLSNAQSVNELRNTLSELKDSAVIEQDLELLPQNDTNHGPEELPSQNDRFRRNDNTSSKPSDSSPLSTTEEDGLTSVTTGISGLKYSDVDEDEFGHGLGYCEAGTLFAKLSDQEKWKMLGSIFPNVKTQDIKDVLIRCDDKFDRSTDELLNLSFLEQSHEDHGDQTYQIPKGIDGFLQEGADGSQRKLRGRGRRNKNRVDHHDSTEAWASDSAMSSGAATPNVWKNLPEDVEFIVSRTHLKPKGVMSLYHANGGRLAPTVRALVIKEGEVYTKASQKSDEIMELQMDELRIDYNHVADSQIYGALVLANNMPGAAKELLDAMLRSSEQPVILGKVTGLASYTPVNLSEDESKPKKKSALSVIGGSNSGVYTTSHLANAHGLAATQAFQQASGAYRRGKSDHLMGGAAAYYASVGHERIKAAKAVQASAADAFVAGQSSSTSLDLHGVNVSDAVRIAQQCTEAWWENLGDRKYVVGGIGGGYRIITGAGKHSADGIGRIGPAVSKMLVREGWRVEVGRGEVVVSGRARR